MAVRSLVCWGPSWLEVWRWGWSRRVLSLMTVTRAGDPPVRTPSHEPMRVLALQLQANGASIKTSRMEPLGSVQFLKGHLPFSSMIGALEV